MWERLQARAIPLGKHALYKIMIVQDIFLYFDEYFILESPLLDKNGNRIVKCSIRGISLLLVLYI